MQLVQLAHPASLGQHTMADALANIRRHLDGLRQVCEKLLLGHRILRA
jgi:hypothetical protein